MRLSKCGVTLKSILYDDLPLLSGPTDEHLFVAIVYKSTDNKNNVKCTRALSQRKIKPIPFVPFPFYCEKQIDDSFLWSILL